MKRILLTLCLLSITNLCFGSLLDGYYEQQLEKCTDNACRKKVLKEAQEWSAKNASKQQQAKVIYVPTSLTDPDDYFPAEPQKIKYGYNSMGDYVPTGIGDNKIHYGYNAVGDYVPMSVGGKQIHYGYNAYGEYVPMSY